MKMTALQIRQYVLDKGRQWECFWGRPSPPQLMGIVRIVLGGWLLFYWAIRFPHVDMLFSEQGIVFPVLPEYWPDSLAFVWDIPSVTMARTMYGLLLASLFSLTIGFSTRISALISFVCAVWFWYLQIHLFHTSFDRLYMFSQLALVMSSAGETFSVHAWRKYGSFWAWKNSISIFPQRLLAVQITFTYFGVGWQKLWLPGWQGGEMLWYSLLGVWGTPLAFTITSYGWSNAYHVVVNVTKIFELVWPFALWIRWKGVRWWLGILGGTIFHIVVDVLLYIWWFAVLIPAYIVFFTPEEVLGMLNKVTKGAIRRV